MARRRSTSEFTRGATSRDSSFARGESSLVRASCLVWSCPRTEQLPSVLILPRSDPVSSSTRGRPLSGVPKAIHGHLSDVRSAAESDQRYSSTDDFQFSQARPSSSLHILSRASRASETISLIAESSSASKRVISSSRVSRASSLRPRLSSARPFA